MKADYISHMGDDLTIVNAARVSFDKESKYAEPGGKSISIQDQRLISYLSREGHFTPFTHCVITLRETVPIFVARQRFKHTVGFSYNEVSRRYVDSDPEFYVPFVWRKRNPDKKQGSLDEYVRDDDLDARYHYLLGDAESLYKDMLDAGVAPEQARMVLPQSMFTSYYVTGSLAAWARAYNLRSKPDAQKEIRDLSEQWDNHIAPLFPVSWRALTQQGEDA